MAVPPDALVHEGAHQNFFDLGLTRDLLGPLSQIQAEQDVLGADVAVAGPRTTCRPLEQVFAAWHAYTCLATFGNTSVVRRAT